MTQPLHKSAFSALKVSWKHVCHEFIAKNPGRAVTRYDFCSLLSEAWFSSMTIKNVVAGFRVTGVCPFDRKAIKIPEECTSFKPESLPQSTGLAYIPLYSPAHTRTHPKIACRDDHGDCSLTLQDTFQAEMDSSDLENSMNVHVGSSDSDDSFDTCSLLQLQDSKSLSQLLRTPTAPCKLPATHQKSHGKVLTSIENMRLMEAREHEKEEKKRVKEERRKVREEKLRNKQCLSGRLLKTSLCM